MPPKPLWVVIPVFNESVAIKPVIESWMAELRKNVPDRFVMVVLNDGSKDKTLEILESLRSSYPELQIVDKLNTGHGQTCLVGYRLAIQSHAEWIFQIDSDGQCDPIFFSEFWKLRDKNDFIFGYRKKRYDGLLRKVVSRILTLTTFLCTFVWVKDANVPYRLMRASLLNQYIDRISSDFYLANIAVSVLIRKNFSIRWVNIHFLERQGAPATRPAFGAQGYRLWKQLRKLVLTK